MKYGKETVETTYYDGKPNVVKRKEVRDMVRDDSEELAHFIKFRSEHVDTKHFTFERKITDKGQRYVIKTWME